MQLDPILQSSPLLDTTNKVIGQPPKIEGESFQNVLKTAIKDVNQLQNDSDQKISSLLNGQSQDIHATIAAVQQADTSFKMMQVRNRIVEAYREISRTGM